MAKIVSATGTATRARGRDIEKAMIAAAAQAQKEGVTDPDEIRGRMLAARRMTRAGTKHKA